MVGSSLLPAPVTEQAGITVETLDEKMEELEALAPHVRYDNPTVVKNSVSRTIIPRDEFIQQLTMDYRLKLEAYDADADTRAIDLKWLKLRSHRWQLLLKQRRNHGTKRRRSEVHDDICTVCQFDLRDQPILEVMPCGHQFHRVCWGDIQSNSRDTRCPICRAQYDGTRNVASSSPPSPTASDSSAGSIRRGLEGLGAT